MQTIPNLNTKADLFDRLIIERLKFLDFESKTDQESANKAKSVDFCIAALKVEIEKAFIEDPPTNALVRLFIELIDAVSTVAYCENTKALLHKEKRVDAEKIAELDKTSRAANEARSIIKRGINALFHEENISEERTF